MKAALMWEYHRPLELVDRPVPEPARHTDVLVRVGAAYLDGAQAYDGEARQLATHLLALYFPPWVPQ